MLGDRQISAEWWLADDLSERTDCCLQHQYKSSRTLSLLFTLSITILSLKSLQVLPSFMRSLSSRFFQKALTFSFLAYRLAEARLSDRLVKPDEIAPTKPWCAPRHTSAHRGNFRAYFRWGGPHHHCANAHPRLDVSRGSRSDIVSLWVRPSPWRRMINARYMDRVTVPGGKLTCNILVVIVGNNVLQPGRLSDTVADINSCLIDTVEVLCE